MDETRREFLTGVVAAAVALAVPIDPLGDGKFNRKLEYGAGVSFVLTQVTEEEREDYRNIIIDSLCEDARKALPSGTPFEIRAGVPTDYGRLLSVCWYYHPDMRVAQNWRERYRADDGWDPRHGYYLLARQLA